MFNNPDWLTSCSSNTYAISLHTQGLRHVSQRTPQTWSTCSMILMTSTSTGWSLSTRRESSEVSSTNILYSNDSLSIVRVTYKVRWVNFDKPESFCLVENWLWLYSLCDLYLWFLSSDCNLNILILLQYVLLLLVCQGDSTVALVPRLGGWVGGKDKLRYHMTARPLHSWAN